MLAAVPPPGKTGSSGKEGRVVIPPFPVLEPFPQQQQQQQPPKQQEKSDGVAGWIKDMFGSN